MTAHEIYHVVVNLCMATKTETAPEDAGAEDRVRRLVEARLKGPGITASRVNVFRASETMPSEHQHGDREPPFPSAYRR